MRDAYRKLTNSHIIAYRTKTDRKLKINQLKIKDDEGGKFEKQSLHGP